MTGLPAAALLGVACLALAGCGGTGERGGLPAPGVDPGPTAGTPSCTNPVDPGRIRADASNRVAESALSASERMHLTQGRDDRSFVARVDKPALEAAGLGEHGGDAWKGRPLLLFVNHGRWTRSDFAVSVDPGTGTSTEPEPIVNWAIYVIPRGDKAGTEFVIGPENDCLRG